MFSLSDDELATINIKVVGVGGAGCNAVNTMIESGLSRVEFVVANTDLQALGRSMASYKIQLGPERARGPFGGGEGLRSQSPAGKGGVAVAGKLHDGGRRRGEVRGQGVSRHHASSAGWQGAVRVPPPLPEKM